jgi:predicted phosphodiesterase
MRVLIISDIHANLAAFNAVLRHTQNKRDAVICLGDLVGYGPDPNECTELAAKACMVVLGGNHDLAAADTLDMADFSRHARDALEWTKSVLSPSNKTYLAGLVPKTGCQNLTFSHGGPEDPIWSYILSESDAETAFADADFDRCFFGHTHVPSAFVLNSGSSRRGRCTTFYGVPGMTLETGKAKLRMLLNPGSVGFPRDAVDAHASDSLRRATARYALFDTETGWWQFRQVKYDMRETAKRMTQLGLW